jgi:DNA-binding NarL/FixJ family response regulator
VTVRVVVADDHPLFRNGLTALIAADERTELVGTARDGDEAVAIALEQRPDVVLMDLRMPHRSGVEATAAITAAAPDIAVLVLTMVDDDASVFAAMRAGARGYVLKGAEPEEIMRSVLVVADGEVIFGRSVAARVLRFFHAPAAKQVLPFPDLTARERDVLHEMAAGAANAAIAGKLYLSEKTVRNIVSSVFRKLQVADRAAAVARARDAGIGPGDGA